MLANTEHVIFDSVKHVYGTHSGIIYIVNDTNTRNTLIYIAIAMCILQTIAEFRLPEYYFINEPNRRYIERERERRLVRERERNTEG